MKKIMFLISMTISFCCFSQTEKVDVSPLTEVMLAKRYSAEDRIELEKNPIKLKTLDYIYSKSFQVVEHQNFTPAQFKKIDISKYETNRKLDDYVLVFDEESGLQLVLFSLNKMEADKKALNPGKLEKKDPASKIAN